MAPASTWRPVGASADEPTAAPAPAPAPAAEPGAATLQRSLRSFLASAVASMLSETVTHPLDFVRVRQQLARGQGHRRTLALLSHAYHNEGVRTIFRGLPPALARHIINTGFAMGMYKPIRDAITGPGDDQPLAAKTLAGMVACSIGQVLSNPLDVVKVRLQRERAEGTVQYHTLRQTLALILRQQGPLALWQGLVPSIQRSAVLGGVALGVYDYTKELLLHHAGLARSDVSSHLCASAVSGAVSALLSTPMDIVRTRMMNDDHMRRSALWHVRRMLREEGALSFFRGSWPTVVRLGAWQLSFFLTYEQLERRVNGAYF